MSLRMLAAGSDRNYRRGEAGAVAAGVKCYTSTSRGFRVS